MSSSYLALGILKSMKAIGLLAPEALPFARFRCASFKALENCAADSELKLGWNILRLASCRLCSSKQWSYHHALGWLLPLVGGQACH